MGIPKDVVEFVAEEGLAKPSGTQSTARTAVVAAAYLGILALAARIDVLAVWVLAWIAMGAVLLSCYAAMHEAIHGHLYSSKRANRIAGAVWGMALLANFSVYRSYHLQHHGHTGVEGDTEAHEAFTGAGQYLFYTPLLGLLFWFQVAGASFASLAGRWPWYARSDRARTAIRVDAAVVGAATLAVAAAAVKWPMTVAAVWGLPFLASTLAASIVTLPQHYGCDQAADDFRSTRTTLSNPVLRFLFWNNNLHAAHHICPTVPYNKLGRLHEYTVDRTAYVSRSYTAFHVELFRDLFKQSRDRQAETKAPASV